MSRKRKRNETSSLSSLDDSGRVLSSCTEVVGNAAGKLKPIVDSPLHLMMSHNARGQPLASNDTDGRVGSCTSCLQCPAVLENNSETDNSSCFSNDLEPTSFYPTQVTDFQHLEPFEEVYSFSDLLKLDVAMQSFSQLTKQPDVEAAAHSVVEEMACDCPSDEETEVSDCDSDLNGSLRLTEDDYETCPVCNRRSVLTARKRKKRSQSRRKTEYNDNYVRKQKHFIDSFLPETDEAFPYWEDWLKPEKANVPEAAAGTGNVVRRKQCTCGSFCRHFYEIMFSRALSADKVYDGMKEPAFFGLQQETVFSQYNFFGPGKLHHYYNPLRASHRIIRRKIEKKYGKHHRMPCASSSDARCSAHRAIQAGERLGLIDVKYELAPKNWKKKNAKNHEANLANYARGLSQISRPSRKSTNNTLKAVCMVFLYHCTASIKGVSRRQIDETRFGRIFNGQPERDETEKYGAGHPKDERQRFNYGVKYERLLNHVVKYPAPMIFCHQRAEVRQSFNLTFNDSVYDQPNADDIMWFTCPNYIEDFVTAWNRKQSYERISRRAMAKRKPVAVYCVSSISSPVNNIETSRNSNQDSRDEDAEQPLDLTICKSNANLQSTCDVDYIRSLVWTGDPEV